ncbi:F-box DNA helicase 1, partial [Frankliniella fusca]
EPSRTGAPTGGGGGVKEFTAPMRCRAASSPSAEPPWRLALVRLGLTRSRRGGPGSPGPARPRVWRGAHCPEQLGVGRNPPPSRAVAVALALMKISSTTSLSRRRENRYFWRRRRDIMHCHGRGLAARDRVSFVSYPNNMATSSRGGVVRFQDTDYRFYCVRTRRKKDLYYGIKSCCPDEMPRKRPKLSAKACSVLSGKLEAENPEDPCQESSVNILDLPTELLIHIFKFFPYEAGSVICKTLRAVNSRFRLASSCALNSALLAIGGRLRRALAALELLLQSQDQADDLRTAARAFNFLENLQCQHRLLLAVTGRLLDADAGRCLYDGALLDEMLQQLDLAVRNPALLVDQHCVHRVNERMRKFMDHFEKVVELPVEPSWLPGAKALDVLDCALEVRRRVLREAVEGGRLHLRVRYSMPRAYFVALPLAETATAGPETLQKGPGGTGGSSSSGDSREERRLVFLRLRRLVQHHNEYTLQKVTY